MSTVVGMSQGFPLNSLAIFPSMISFGRQLVITTTRCRIPGAHEHDEVHAGKSDASAYSKPCLNGRAI